MKEMNEPKHTPESLPWIADLRGGCCAVYPESRKTDTNGCHADDERNILYSSKAAKFNGQHWEMDAETQRHFEYIVKACNERPAMQARIAELEGLMGQLIDACDGNYKELVDEAKAALAKAQPEGKQ